MKDKLKPNVVFAMGAGTTIAVAGLIAAAFGVQGQIVLGVCGMATTVCGTVAANMTSDSPGENPVVASQREFFSYLRERGRMN